MNNDNAIQWIITTIFGIGLPSFDIGSDIYLALRLLQNGHPNFAFCVLFPVLTNTVFTIFVCVNLEKRKCWRYLPLVFLQIYPQFCTARLLYKWARGEMGIDEFKCQRDSLDGGLGCVEPYMESVPQAFIQTAIFAVAYNLSTTATRLCYNENARSCRPFDTCSDLKKCSAIGHDNNNCDPVGFQPYSYKSNDEILDCKNKTQLCATDFEDCIEPFFDCIRNCTANLTEQILKIDETELYESYANDNTNWTNHFLASEYNSTLVDTKSVQLYLLFVGDKNTFMATYSISIFAAAYGATKFLRLGYARHCAGIDRAYIGSFLNTLYYLLLKGYALAMFVKNNENEMKENVQSWLLFCVLPSFAFQFIVIIVTAGYSVCSNGCYGVFCLFPCYSFKVIFQEPSIIASSVVAPYIYSSKVMNGVTRVENNVSYHYAMACFQLNVPLTCINHFIVGAFTTAGLIYWTHFDLAITVICSVVILIVHGGLLYVCILVGQNIVGDIHCLRHNTSMEDCSECIKLHGFYILRNEQHARSGNRKCTKFLH